MKGPNIQSLHWRNDNPNKWRKTKDSTTMSQFILEKLVTVRQT